LFSYSANQRLELEGETKQIKDEGKNKSLIKLSQSARLKLEEETTQIKDEGKNKSLIKHVCFMEVTLSD
jgi:hypothetical protein